jgi:hypothetical protein
MRNIVKISDLPSFMNAEELLEVKGGASGDNVTCVLTSAVKCNAAGSGVAVCKVANSGVIIYPSKG